MILTVLLALTACSTPAEAPKAAPVAAAPAPAPMPAGMPMAGHDMEAHEGHHEGEAAHGAGAEAEEEEAAAGSPTVVPDSYAGIITEMRTRQANIAALMAAGKYKEVHPQAKVIMDLAVAAPGKAPAAGKATASLKALDLKEKADELHDKADEGDAAGAKVAFEAVAADIDALAAVSK